MLKRRLVNNVDPQQPFLVVYFGTKCVRCRGVHVCEIYFQMRMQFTWNTQDCDVLLQCIFSIIWLWCEITWLFMDIRWTCVLIPCYALPIFSSFIIFGMYALLIALLFSNNSCSQKYAMFFMSNFAKYNN